jgi:hypothetical protein
MAQSKYTLYKYVKLSGTWRYCKAAYHENGKIKPDIVFVNAKEGLLEKHAEGRYYMSHKGSWIDAGTDALVAQRKRKQRLALDEFNRLSAKGSAQSAVALLDSPDRITLASAAEKYFANCEARGLDSRSIRKYRSAVDPFVEHCGATYVDECRDNKQVLLDYMSWLRKQTVPVRKRSDGSSSNNPKRTLANKVGDARIFLKSLGISKLLSKHEEPTYHEKKVVAHTDDELVDLLLHLETEPCPKNDQVVFLIVSVHKPLDHVLEGTHCLWTRGRVLCDPGTEDRFRPRQVELREDSVSLLNLRIITGVGIGVNQQIGRRLLACTRRYC